MSATPRQLQEAALAATRKGITVIPFNAVSKLPKLAWGIFLEIKPTEDEIIYWSKLGMFDNGLAFLTGNTSGRLLVVDFDDLGKASEFEEKFRDLAKTYKVETARGIHYYYRAAQGFEPSQRQLEKVDILWDSPVIAAPSEGKNVVNSQISPRSISMAEYNAVIRYFAPDSEPSSTEAAPVMQLMSMADIVQAFSNNASRESSRNKALFNALCLARDNGFTEYECITGNLMDIFVYAKAPLAHGNESLKGRMKEFHRTLKSVYKHAPRDLQGREIRFISDDARQRLIGAGLIGAARLLDALAHHFAPGAIVTRQQIIKAVGGIIAHEVIDSALKACFEGKFLFSRVSPSPAPHPDNALEKDINKNAIYGRKKTGFNHGRPNIAFKIPSPAMIQQITGAIYRSSTTIKIEQIDSVRDYRAAQLKSKLDRERVKHFQGFLGRIVGVVERTIRNYIGHIGYEGIPQHETIKMITWDNVDEAFSFGSEWSKAYYLLDHTGKKYPAKKGAALWLLKAKKAIRLMKQSASIYMPKKSAENYKSGKFEAELADIMAQQTGQKPQGIAHTPNRLNPNHPHFDEKAYTLWLAHETGKSVYWDNLKMQRDEQRLAAGKAAQSQDLESRWEDIKLSRAKMKEVKEQAATLCMLMPSKLISHDNAARLLLQFGTETVMQCATKAIIDYHFSKRGKRPIKNVVAVIIARLKKGWKPVQEKPRMKDDSRFLTPQNLADGQGVNKGVWDTGEKLGY